MRNFHIQPNIWKIFVQEDVLDTNRISKRIAESWFRCKSYNVNPYLDKGRTILADNEYEKRITANQELIELSTPYLQAIRKSINDTSTIILTDVEGVVLKIIAKDASANSLNRINLVQGVKWTENEVGTNAIGTAIEIQEPIHVVGKEHFSVASHNFSCSAAPIKNSRGELVGILDISNNNINDLNLNHLSLVVSAAHAIQSEWRLQEQQKRIALVEQFIQCENTSEVEVIISDIDGYFVSASSSIMDIIKDNTDLYNTPIKNFQDIGIQFFGKCPIYSKEYRLLGYRHEVKYINESMKNYVSRGIFNFAGEKGISSEFSKVIHEMEMVSKSDITISIYGESGTGKEVVAKSIHLNSKRKDKPFVAVNCGAIPKDLLESELFGYVDGAFTGAKKKGYKGKFLQANGGTLFLDEIGEMPFSMQVSLLRVIQEKEVVPIGGQQNIPIDIRIITATNKNLGELVQRGEFREDLYYRLHVFDLKLPPLRERRKDIPHLINYFLQHRKLNVKFSPAIIDCLTEYTWPGNIRELFNVLEKMIVLADEKPLKLTHIPDYIREKQNNGPTNGYQKGQFSNKESVQRENMLNALQITGGNVYKASALINVPISTFYRKMKKFNL
ncbi:sigma-54-dependent Fis family transcriptional regulator [Peribacillus asahii]|uniref:sigma-54-dependent Fis family transcriptional regulator n=1 Tax=Peribacillus asahii TaxID=228899 RepID=UPI003811AB37